MSEPDENRTHYALDVSASLAIGDGIGLRRSGRTTQTEIVESIYFDTAHGDLATRGFALRCQPGDSQTGWQLRQLSATTLPVVQVGLNADATTPAEILDRTFGVRAGEDLVEFARIRAEHTTHELMDGRDRLVCALVDSVFSSTASVASSAGSTVSARQWRTLRLDPTSATVSTDKAEPTSKAEPTVLARLDRQLRKAGAKLADPRPELATALDGAVAGGVSARRDVVGDYVRAQRDAMLLGDVRLRPSASGVVLGRGLGESEEADIHDARVAVRRLRSTLRTFAKAFDGVLARELEGELTWYAGVLGQLRDQQVLLDRVLTALAQVPAELVLGPVATTISEHLLNDAQRHRRTLRETLSSPRYLALLGQVDAVVRGLAESKPLSGRDIRIGLAKAEGRLARRLAEARDQYGTPTADIASHTARKAAKRARYAAELAAPVLNHKDAKATIKRLQRLQDSLGNHQDGVVAADLLRRLGAAAAQPGQNGFTFGLLYEREAAALRADREALRP